MDLKKMGLTEIFIRYTDSRFRYAKSRLCRRLDGVVRTVGDMVFIPVEDFHTGERFEPRMDHLHLCVDMEIIALAAQKVTT